MGDPTWSRSYPAPPQVWRSDVHFARKQLLCPDGERGSWRGLRGQWKWVDTPFTAPLPVSHRHFGLLGLVLALGLVVTVLLLNCRGAWRPDDGEEHLGGLQEGWQEGLECQGVPVPGLQGSQGGGWWMLLDARMSPGDASRTRS